MHLLYWILGAWAASALVVVSFLRGVAQGKSGSDAVSRSMSRLPGGRGGVHSLSSRR
jgi:hypothetical protein